MGDEKRITRDRASRSRSKTPFLRSSCDRELCKSTGVHAHSGNHHLKIQYQKSFTAVAESKEQAFSFKYSDNFLGTASVTGAAKLQKKGKINNIDVGITENKITNLPQINGVYKNSKERNDNSVTVTSVLKKITAIKRSDFKEDSKNIELEAHRTFKLYKDSGDWWNVFPKTDYTYSEYSPYRREIAPGIVNMPNMSRPGLRNSNSRHEYVQQNSGIPSYDRTRYTTTYQRKGSELRDEKWARVLGTEYAANQTVRQDHLSLQVPRANISRFFTSIIYFFSNVITWSRESIYSLWSNTTFSEPTYLSTSGNFGARILHWLYCLLGYVKFVDTWLLMGWSFFDISSHTNDYDHRSHKLWSKLIKIFLVLSPILLLLAGLWAYIQFWDDQGVSKSVSIPEPNEPLLTSNLKTASGNVIQDFGANSVLKILSSSLTSYLHTLWIWLLYPWVSYNQTNNMVVTSGDMYVPFTGAASVDRVKVVEECPQPNIDIDELVSKIKANPAFVNLLSIPNMLEQDHLNQKSRSTLQFEELKNMLKADIALAIDGIAKTSKSTEERISDKISKLDDEISKLKKIAMDIDSVAAQTRYLNNLIQEESTLRETSIISLTQDMLKWKEEKATQVFHDCEKCDFSDSNMKKIVTDALMLYDADKTGMADYALESSGGSIVSTRCTETYHAKTASLSWFNFHLWYTFNNPRTIIQPSTHPGECWAFKGSQGYVVIKLSHKIYVSMFTLEHIPKVLAPVGTIDSAPRNFSVWGLGSDIDTEGQLFGEYFYDQDGSTIQYFPVQRRDLPPYQYIELRIESNHDNLEYTCIYRFRVHGSVHQEANGDLIKDKSR